jgi:hypothetical protein
MHVNYATTLTVLHRSSGSFRAALPSASIIQPSYKAWPFCTLRLRHLNGPSLALRNRKHTMDFRPRPSKATREMATLPPPPEDGSLRVLEVDFKQYGLPELSSRTCIVIDNLLTPDDVRKLYTSATSSGEWKAAQVNVGQGREVLIQDYRNSDRIILDSHELAGWLFEKVQPHLPAHVVTIPNAPHHARLRSPAYKDAKDKSNVGVVSTVGRALRIKAAEREPDAKCSRVNERLRFLRYGKGMFFNPHFDGQYWTPDKKEVSYYTLQVYLNGEEDDGESPDDLRQVRAGRLTVLICASRTPRRRSHSYLWQRSFPPRLVNGRRRHVLLQDLHQVIG